MGGEEEVRGEDGDWVEGGWGVGGGFLDVELRKRNPYE